MNTATTLLIKIPMKRINWFLTAILTFGFLLRITWLGQIPAGFTADEASQAYSAYSLLKTGADEWGITWPSTSFRSFFDYKAPLQTYLMIPSIAIFGLSEFAARLPSAIFGTLAILVIYFLGKKINPKIGLLAAFLLAISPWHLQFSRTALEVNLSSFLFPAGLLFFIKGLKNPKFFYLTALAWGLNLYAYHAARLFTPLFIIAILILNFKKFSLTKCILPICIFLVLAIPTYYSMFFGAAGARGNDLLLTKLSSQEQEQVLDQASFSPLNNISPVLSKLFSNNLSYTLDKFSENYISYYTPSFWFTQGGWETTYSIIPGRGLLYLWQLPFVIFGLIYIFKNKPKNYQLLVAWLFLAALPAALTHEGSRPNRAGSFLGLWEIIIAIGIVYLYQLYPRFKKTLSLIIFALAATSFVFYLNDYLFLTKVKYPDALSYGWRDTINFVSQASPNYSQVKLPPQGQTQAFVTFYTKFPPTQFQQESQDWWEKAQGKDVSYLDQLGEYTLGKFSFEPLNWPEDINQDTLYISHVPNQLLPVNRRTLFTVQTPKKDKILIEVFDFR